LVYLTYEYINIYEYMGYFRVVFIKSENYDSKTSLEVIYVDFF